MEMVLADSRVVENEHNLFSDTMNILSVRVCDEWLEEL